MKSLFLSVGMLFSLTSISAQTIPLVNGNFEGTMTPNSNYVNTYEMPGWLGFNSAPETTTPYEGTQAVKIEVTVDPFLNSWLSFGSDTVPGYIVQAVDGPFIEDTYFTRVSFAYKFTQMETDTAYIQFGIIDNNQSFLYINELFVSNTVDWTFVSMDLLYFMDGVADKFVFYATPAIQDYGTVTNHTITPGTTLWIDDVHASNYAEIKEDKSSPVSIYPNPASDFVTISSEEKMDEIQIVSVDGKVLSTVQPESINTTLSLEHLQAGTYFVRVSIDGITLTSEVIKQ